MGLPGSKVGKQISVEDLQEGSVPSTPILTPKIRDKYLDPRSPSSHISRTPLELLSAAAEKLGDLKIDQSYESTDTPTRTQAIILGIDPRSPTTDFVRTPIIINSRENDLPKKIYNKNLEKVLRSEIATPKLNGEKSVNIPPKLLDSSPIRSRPEVYKRKSFVGLLETNIDFTETDLDAVQREKTRTLNTTPKQNLIRVVQDENMDPRSPSTDFMRTPIQIIKEIGEVELSDQETHSIIQIITNNEEEEVMVEEMSDNVGEVPVPDEINVTSSQTSTNNDSEGDIVENAVSEVIFETKSAPVSPPCLNETKQVLCLNESKSAPVSPPLVDLTADVKELDKKLTNLIYEDQDIVVCPRIVKLKDTNERSPLRNRNGIEPEKKKSAQKLRVSDKPRKSEFVVSKIPVFKEKVKGKVQCENTPPRGTGRNRLGKKSQWDNADTTLYL